MSSSSRYVVVVDVPTAHVETGEKKTHRFYVDFSTEDNFNNHAGYNFDMLENHFILMAILPHNCYVDDPIEPARILKEKDLTPEILGKVVVAPLLESMEERDGYDG